MSIVSYPTPLYTNPPINPQYYQPRKYDISNITRGQTTVVTTDGDNDYVVGQEVRLIIPPGFGIRQLNNRTGFVLSLPSSNQVELDIDSTAMDNFVDPGSIDSAQILAIGDINTGMINTIKTQVPAPYIPGSFINISPN